MPIVPEAVKMLITGVVFAAVSLIINIWFRWAGITLLVLSLIFIAFVLFFFRDPARDRIFAPGEICAPGDGKILSVSSEDDSGTVVVRIFLSIFNAHLQRSPMDGEIKSVRFEKGTFEAAYKPGARKNQKNTIRIEAGDGKFADVEQITGAIARKISCYVKEGDEVKIGDKLGMIYFGSQVALRLPASRVNILVKEGEKVEAGETVIGLWKK